MKSWLAMCNGNLRKFTEIFSVAGMAACTFFSTSSRLLAATARLPRMFYSKSDQWIFVTYVRMFNM